MPAHVQHTYIVEKHDSSNRCWLDGRAKETPDPNVTSSGFIDYC
jgi:hypothetical protein